MPRVFFGSRAIAGLVFAAGAVLTAVPASAATLMVDDDRVQCPKAQFTSINAAIIAAAPGDTIRVCPGLYNESVLVNKPIELIGTLVSGNAWSHAPQPLRDAIVDPPDGGFSPGFDVEANYVEVSSFVVQGATNNPGIYTSRAFPGYDIENNIIHDNTFGMYLNSSGVETSEVARNFLFANNWPGAASGVGVYSDHGLHDAEIHENLLTGQLSASLVIAGDFSGPFDTDVSITHNDIIDDSSIAIFDTVGLEVSHNSIQRASGSGVFIGGGVGDATIDHNDIEQATGTGIDVEDLFPAPNSNLLISHNQLSSNAFDGILLFDASQATVEHNRAQDNGRDGLRVDGASALNLIQQNQLEGNGEHDAHDDTVGPGTAGTANLWIKNQCKTDNRAGALCAAK